MLAFIRLNTFSKESVTTMRDSGEKINYTLRPAKGVERKILCDILSKCETTVPIHNYRYIGFGSFYYSDFILFHNQLNIEKMISIESSTDIDRYTFNKPYKCVDLIQGDSATVLGSQIEFSKETRDIIWLDYDGTFSKEMIADFITIASKISPDSFLFSSFNSSIISPHIEMEKQYIELKEQFGDFLPEVDPKNISEAQIPGIVYEIIDGAIQKAVNERNIVEDTKIIAKSFFYVKYRDGAPMLTIGYYFSDADGWAHFQSSKAKDSPWFSTEKNPQKITIPCFTKAEIIAINRYLPGSTPSEILSHIPHLKETDIANYIKIYKYYPNFLDSNYYI